MTDFNLRTLRKELLAVLPDSLSLESLSEDPSAQSTSVKLVEKLKTLCGGAKDRTQTFHALVSRRLKFILLSYLGTLTHDKVIAERHLSSFFRFTATCLKETLLEPGHILELFEDLFECSPESMLATFFPLFERAILSSTGESSAPVAYNLDQITKTCRKIMTKLTVTHDLQLRGALLRFLAQALPLTHPSGKLQHYRGTRRH